jgi:2-hydroxymuconate-semialdehyde hydrolase
MPSTTSAPSGKPLPAGVQGRFIQVDGIRTHYLESRPEDREGRDPVVLVHSGEFGARAELSWRYNLAELAKHFHVYAPDLVGFGRTERLYSFSDPAGFRIRHLRRFLETLDIGPAHFIGNSFGGSLTLAVAATPQPAWPIRSIVAVSGGGHAPDNEARRVLTGYTGKREEMRDILKVLFFDERWWADDLVEERWRASREPGVWEAGAAARLAPEGLVRGFQSQRPDYTKIRCPVLVVAGEHDLLRPPNYWKELEAAIPQSTVNIFARARHCAHIEHADAFNQLAIDFLKGQAARR